MNKDLKYYLNLPYKTILEYEPDDKTWVAYCAELGRGTCYAIGESKSAALELLEKSKITILEYALAEGKEIPEPIFIEDDELPSGNFIIRVPRSTHRKLKVEAENEGVSLNQYVLSVLSEHLGLKIANSKNTKVISNTGFNYELSKYNSGMVKENKIIEENPIKKSRKKHI